VNGPAATLEDVIAAAASRSASLVPETSGYLILGVVEAAQRVPLFLDLRSVLITAEGDVVIRPSGEVVSPAEAGRQLRGLLGQLLAVSAGDVSGLRAAASPARAGEIDALMLDIEAALIPMNRAAGRRAIARLARDTLRAGARGVAQRPAPPAPPPAIAPVEPPAPPSHETLSEPPAHRAASTPAATPTASIPRPASPGERKLEALRGSLARNGLRSPWVGWSGDSRFSDRTPSNLATSPSPSASTCSASAPTVPLAIAEPEGIESAPAIEVEQADVEVSDAIGEVEAIDASDVSDIEIEPADGTSLDHVAAARPDESIPLWIEMAGDVSAPIVPLDPRGLTMRWSFAKDGSTGLLEGGAPVAGRAEILAFFEQTPSAPIELVGSPTIAMSIEPFAAEPPSSGETLPWPASYPYERLSGRPAVIFEAPIAAPPALESASSDPAEPEEISHLAEPAPLDPLPAPALVPPTPSLLTSDLTFDAPEQSSTSDAAMASMIAAPSEPGAALEIPEPPAERPAETLSAAPNLAAPEPAAAGPDRADELLLRFAAGSDGETANIRAAAKGLRAIAGVDLTPTAASLIPAATLPAPPEPSPDDITPPATSPGPASARSPRPARRGLLRSALAFAAGLAGATAVMHVEPSFPERVAELLDQAIPAADPPSPPAIDPAAVTPPAEGAPEPPPAAREAGERGSKAGRPIGD
jgi:hypothetical protein